MIEAGSSRLVLARDESLVSREAAVDPEVMSSILGEGMAKLTGGSVADAWTAYFRSDDIVGIKVNTAFGPTICVHIDLIWAMIEGLKSAGVNEQNIYVWDQRVMGMARSRYPINEREGAKFVGANEFGFPDDPITQGSFHGKVCNLLLETVTAVINVPILKDHNISGVTNALKNHYGSIDNPREHHANHCDPAIADLNSISAIKDKTRLVVCDAVRPLAEGGPRDNEDHRWDYNGLMLSTDPVALDYWGWQIIEERRRETGLPSLAEAGREPKWIASAAARGLGTNDPDRIGIVE